MKRELIATSAFGLEAVVRREIEALGFKVLKTEDGKVTYSADERGIVRSDLWLRCADRVLLKAAEFDAPDFEALFQQTKAVPWEEWIPADGRFTVTCTTVRSKLHNEPACQRTVKKAIVCRLREFYVTDLLPETGAEHTVKLTLLKDRAVLTIDTSGTGLHKRGYRTADVAAPMKETLAAALVQLSFWNPERILVDPCCGSGTIPIEAAMIGMRVAPGLSRKFASEEWDFIPRDLWREERQAAFREIRTDAGLRIYGYDIDRRAVAAARENAAEAGVDDQIVLGRADVRKLLAEGSAGKAGAEAPWKNEAGAVFVTNPPYAVRIGTAEELEGIYRALKNAMSEDPTRSLFAITADKSLEEAMGRKADRRRKLYNGTIETTYYQFHGTRPDKG